MFRQNRHALSLPTTLGHCCNSVPTSYPVFTLIPLFPPQCHPTSNTRTPHGTTRLPTSHPGHFHSQISHNLSSRVVVIANSGLFASNKHVPCSIYCLQCVTRQAYDVPLVFYARHGQPDIPVGSLTIPVACPPQISYVVMPPTPVTLSFRKTARMRAWAALGRCFRKKSSFLRSRRRNILTKCMSNL